ncbi:MAG: glycoside hydrolase family 2 protein [Thermomicrobiales bacterium]
MSWDGDHPRPQMVRDTWHDLSGPWQFAFDDADTGLRDGWAARLDVFDGTITVPFPPESAASGIHDTAPHRVVWYRRGFRLPATGPGGRWLLHFGAVDYRAQVWVDGQLVAWHEGGHTPFAADVTAALRDGLDEHVVVVRAEDEPTDLTQPRGKQHWERDPAEIWYYRTTGIWQPVWLEPVPETFIAAVRWTPDVARGLLGLEVRLNHAAVQPLRLQVRLTLHGTVLADDSYAVEGAEIRRQIAISIPSIAAGRNRFLWSPEHPNLIDAELTIADAEIPENVLDRVGSYAGLRSVGIANGRFLLNGDPYYLRMALAQGYWPESHLAAPSGDALRREVELAKALGFNGLRIHQKVEDPRFLAWCDRIGLVVWGEMANAYAFTATAVERFTREWIEAVRRDYSHPCIVTWVPFNESWGVPNLEGDPMHRHYVWSIYHLTHALDPTRPVIGNDGWEHFASDVWGIHDYALEAETIRARYGSADAVARSIRDVHPYHRPIVLNGVESKGEPVMLTECGGIDLVPDAGNPDGLPRRAADADDFLDRFSAVLDAILACPTIQGFCYTQLTDVEQEKCGFVTADRRPKIDPAMIHPIVSRPAAAIPAQATLGVDLIPKNVVAEMGEANVSAREIQPSRT